MQVLRNLGLAVAITHNQIVADEIVRRLELRRRVLLAQEAAISGTLSGARVLPQACGH